MKIGVIGAGGWGARVISEYSQLKREGKIDQLYVFDVDISRARSHKESSNFVVCESIEEMLKNVDGVHICAPDKYHFDLAKQSMEHGRHVLIEKPFVTSMRDAQRLAKMAKERRLVLEVGHLYRFANALKKAAELYRKGYFGKVYYINFYWTHIFNNPVHPDVMWDLMPHLIDMYNMITGEWPKKFAGFALPMRRQEHSEVTFIEARTRNGPVSTYHVSWLSPIRKREIEIVGSKRSAHIDAVEQTIKVFAEGGKNTEVRVRKNNTIREEELNFISSIRQGKAKVNTVELGIRNVDTILQIQYAFRHYTMHLIKNITRDLLGR